MIRSALNCLVFWTLASAASAATPPSAFLKAHCTECHDKDTKKGNLDLTVLKSDFADAENFARCARRGLLSRCSGPSRCSTISIGKCSRR